MSPAEVRAFVLPCLKALGARAVEVGGGVELELPASLAEAWDCPRKLRAVWSSPGEGAGAGPVEVLAPGSRLLDHLIQHAAGRGRAAALLLPAGLTGGPAVRAGEALTRVRLLNGRLRDPSARVLLHRQVLFYFKVAYASDETHEELCPLLLDPVSEEPVPLVDLEAAVPCILPGDRPEEGGERREAYTLFRLYRRACEHLERRVRRRGAEEEKAAQKRLAAEQARLDGYYEALRREALDPWRRVLYQVASARARARALGFLPVSGDEGGRASALLRQARRLEAELDRELAALEEERRRRHREAAARYRVGVEVRLTHAAVIRVPRLEVTCRAVGPVARPLTFLYDLARDRVLDLDCGACGRELAAFYLCRCEETVCGDCFSPCASCGRSACALCRHAACHLCGAGLCGSCPGPCPLAGELAATRGLAVCPACREMTCPVCISLARYGLGEGGGNMLAVTKG